MLPSKFNKHHKPHTDVLSVVAICFNSLTLQRLTTLTDLELEVLINPSNTAHSQPTRSCETHNIHRLKKRPLLTVRFKLNRHHIPLTTLTDLNSEFFNKSFQCRTLSTHLVIWDSQHSRDGFCLQILGCILYSKAFAIIVCETHNIHRLKKRWSLMLPSKFNNHHKPHANVFSVVAIYFNSLTLERLTTLTD